MTRPLVLPPLRRTARDAEAFARHVHADQLDKAGRPYAGHLHRVAVRAHQEAYALGRQGKWPDDPNALDDLLQIAWLHDVIEDGKATGDDLLREGFSMGVVERVRWLSKPRHEPCAAWIAELALHAPLPALLVKIADTEDNADPARLALLDEETRDRLTRKYAASLPILRAAVEGRRT